MSEDFKNKKFIFRLSEKDRLLFEKNFFLSGVNSKAEYIRRLITNYEVPSKLDVAHINELRRLAGLFGKNTGLLKLHISSLDDISKKRIDTFLCDCKWRIGKWQFHRGWMQDVNDCEGSA